MLERIRKEELGASMLKIVLLVIIGCVLIGISGIHKIIIGPTPLTHLDQEKLEGKFVTYDMWLSFDSFAEMIYTVDGQETSEFQDFLIPVEEYYMAVRIYPLQYEKMARFVEESFAWIDYETDELPDIFKIDGVIEKWIQKNCHTTMIILGCQNLKLNNMVICHTLLTLQEYLVQEI